MLPAVWLLTRAVAVLLLVHDLYSSRHLWLLNGVVGDVSLGYRQAAVHMLHGSIPYVNFRYEYPPASLIAVGLVAEIFGTLRHHFTEGWIALMVALDAGVTLALSRWPGRVRDTAAWTWVILVPLLGAFIYVRNDLIVVAAVVGAVWLGVRRKPAGAGAAWTFAVLAKVWPAVPLALYLACFPRSRRKTVLGVVAATAVTAVVLTCFGMLTATLRDLNTTQGHRPLEVESTWAVSLVLIAFLQDRRLRYDHSYGSFNLASGVPHGLAPIAYHATQALFVAGLLAALWLARRRRPTTATTFAWCSIAFVALTIAVAPVLSPQYVLWLVGVVCVLVALGERSRASTVLLVLTAAIAIATQLEYPFLFTQVLHQQAAATLVVAIRDALLVIVGVLAVVQVAHQAQIDRVRPR